MKQLMSLFDSIYPVNDALEADLRTSIKRKSFLKKTYLLEEGDVSDRIYFIEKGLARAYHYKDGKEITSWFMAENEVIVSVYSFFLQKPGFEYIELLEDSIIYSLDYVSLQQIYQKHIEFNVIGRILTEKYYVRSEERAISLRMLSATERYEHFMENHASLAKRISLFYIASYLGVSRETLSRIRPRLNNFLFVTFVNQGAPPYAYIYLNFIHMEKQNFIHPILLCVLLTPCEHRFWPDRSPSEKINEALREMATAAKNIWLLYL